jgi:hypothetical protein
MLILFEIWLPKLWTDLFKGDTYYAGTFNYILGSQNRLNQICSLRNKLVRLSLSATSALGQYFVTRVEPARDNTKNLVSKGRLLVLQENIRLGWS